MKNLLIVIIGLIYIISPLDLIPDVIPLFGWIDDVVVLAFTIHRGIKILGWAFLIFILLLIGALIFLAVQRGG